MFESPSDDRDLDSPDQASGTANGAAGAVSAVSAVGAAPTQRPLGTLGTVLMAAMLGLADALGWDRDRDNGSIIQLAPDLDTGDLPLDFGPLPPLD